jgi:hypothetical protein
MTIPESNAHASGKSKKSAWINMALFAVGMGLLGWSIYSNRIQLQRCLSGELHYSWIFQAFLLHFLGVMIAFLRWFGLVRLQGIRIPLADSLRLSIVGGLFNLIIPGAVGGDLVKAAYLSRMDLPRTRVIASMVIDRLLGLLGLFLLAAMAGLSAWPSSDLPVKRLTIAVLIATSAIIIFLALIFSGIVGKKSQKMAELNAMFQIVPLVLFSTAVPLPLGAIGFSENVSDQLFQNVGHPNGAIAMMGFRILQYAFAAISALIYWANMKSMKNLTDQKQD